MSIYYTINLDIVSSYMFFNYLYLRSIDLLQVLINIIIFFFKKKEKNSIISFQDIEGGKRLMSGRVYKIVIECLIIKQTHMR